jgi:SAM-dependent methyltransferase
MERAYRNRAVAPASDDLSLQERHYPESRFGDFTDVDGTIAFYVRVDELLPPDGVALDVGCGRGTQGDDPIRTSRSLRTLRGRCRRVIGLDVDAEAAANPFVDEFRAIEGDRWPVETGSVDLCVADFVLEHVDDPERFVAESARALRPGGHLCVRTINAWSYLGLASRLVPNRLHPRLLGRVQPARRADDVFPVRYRCNSLRRLRAVLDRHGFDAAVYGYEAEPDYLAFSPLAYRLGVWHERLAPSAIRVGIHAFARRR